MYFFNRNVAKLLCGGKKGSHKPYILSDDRHSGCRTKVLAAKGVSPVRYIDIQT